MSSILQTSRSHINMIENLFKLQLQQNEVLQQKLNDAERKSNKVKKIICDREKMSS